jgi:hypothetical protein
LVNTSGRRLNIANVGFSGGGREVHSSIWLTSGSLSASLFDFPPGGCLGLWGLNVPVQAAPGLCVHRHGWWSTDGGVRTEGQFMSSTRNAGGKLHQRCTRLQRKPRRSARGAAYPPARRRRRHTPSICCSSRSALPPFTQHLGPLSIFRPPRTGMASAFRRSSGRHSWRGPSGLPGRLLKFGSASSSSLPQECLTRQDVATGIVLIQAVFSICGKLCGDMCCRRRTLWSRSA